MYMRVTHISQSDVIGGAARASYRIHKSLLSAGIQSRMWVEKALSGDSSVQTGHGMFSTNMSRITAAVRARAARQLARLQTTSNTSLHSPSVLPSRWVNRINTSDADIVHLHWVQGEMLSVSDIGRINKPIIWTLHDMWPICGAEHYATDHRWRDGYSQTNRPAYESGLDINRWTWQRKLKLWKRPMHIVAPSQWLADCARASVLLGDWPIDVILNPIDVEKWKPIDQGRARDILGLPQHADLLLFGAMGGGQDARKGFDLLAGALGALYGKVSGLELVVFGESRPREPVDLGFPVHYVGQIHDDLQLRLLYSAASAFALPSRQDNLPLTCIEALACGTPVVAFDTCGPPTIIQHKQTGFLASAFDCYSFAEGLKWALDKSNQPSVRLSARHFAEHSFSYATVASQYVEAYEKVLSK